MAEIVHSRGRLCHTKQAAKLFLSELYSWTI